MTCFEYTLTIKPFPDIYTSILGNFGKYQLRNAILMGMTGLTFSWIQFGTKFLTYDVDFWCAKVKKSKHLEGDLTIGSHDT